MLAPTIAVPTDQRVLMTFRLDRQLYALPIAPVVQIIEMVAIIPLPQVHAAIRGVVNWHGTLAPVIDLRGYLGLPEVPPRADTHIILAQVGGRLTGLIVDTALDVIHLSGHEIVHPADILPIGLTETSRVVEGLARTPNGLVLLLDLEQLTTHSPLNFAAVSSALAAQSVASAEPAPDQIATDPIPERVA